MDFTFTLRDPVFTRLKGGRFVLTYNDMIRFEVTNPSNLRSKLDCEVKIELRPEAMPEYKGDRRVYWGTIGLHSKTNIAQTVQRCVARAGVFDKAQWEEIIWAFCWDAAEKIRAPGRKFKVGSDPLPQTPAFLLRPFLRKLEPTVIFGEGGTGKSLTAMFMASLIANDVSACDLVPTPGPVMYIDWESNRDIANERIRAIKNGLIEDEVAFDTTFEMDYWPATRPLAEWSSDLLVDVEDNGYELVVIDSATMALGGYFNDADAVIPLFEALRALDVTVLIVDHKAKDSGSKDPIGSVTKTNLARSVWEIRREEQAQNLTIGLFHRKVNQGRKLKPIGLEIVITEDTQGRMKSVQFRSTDVSESDDLSEGLSTYERIRKHITDAPDAALAARDLYDLMPDVRQPTIRSTLNRYFQKLTGNKWAMKAHEDRLDPDRQAAMDEMMGAAH